MATSDCHAYALLSLQINRQKKYAWDVDRDIPWNLGIDKSRYLLPLDENAIAFPGIGQEQRLALSQLVGLIVNATIAEMENAIDRVRDHGWIDYLRRFPVNPEMEALGALFFAEELKHARLFKRYNAHFCDQMGIEPDLLHRILPKLFGSRFIDIVTNNAKGGGHAFWWIVAIVEEASIKIFQQMTQDHKAIDPLFYEVHRRHTEEETRHCNFAFLVLDMIANRPFGFRELFHRKTDLILAQTISGSWLLIELQKIWRLKNLRTLHPFFSTLASCLPHFRKHPLTLYHFFSKSPYLSLFLNVRNHPQTVQMIKRLHPLSFPLPLPRPAKTFAG